MPAPRKGIAKEKAETAVAAADSGGAEGSSQPLTAMAQSPEDGAAQAVAQCPLGSATNLEQSSAHWPLAATAGSDMSFLACSEPGSPSSGEPHGQRDLWSSESKRGQLARCKTHEFEPTLAGLLARSVVGSGLRQVDSSPVSPPSRQSAGSDKMRFIHRSPDYSPMPSTSSFGSGRQGSAGSGQAQDEPHPDRVHPGSPLSSPECSPNCTPSMTPEVLRMRPTSKGSAFGNDFHMTCLELARGSSAKSVDMKLSTPNGTVWQGRDAENSMETREAHATLGAAAASLREDFEAVGHDFDSDSNWTMSVLRTLYLEAQHSPSSSEPRPGIRNISTAAIARTFGLGAVSKAESSLPISAASGSGIASGYNSSLARSHSAGGWRQGVPAQGPLVPKLDFANVHMGDDEEEDDEDFENKVGCEAAGVATSLPQSSAEQQKEKLVAFGVPQLHLNGLPQAVDEEGFGGSVDDQREAVKLEPQMKASASAVELRDFRRKEESAAQGSKLPPAAPPSNWKFAKGAKSRHALSMYIDDQTLMIMNMNKGKPSKQQRKNKDRPSPESSIILPPLQAEKQRLVSQVKMQRSPLEKGKGIPVVHSHIHHHIHFAGPSGASRESAVPTEAPEAAVVTT